MKENNKEMWNYRWIRYKDLFLHEVYYDEAGNIAAITKSAVSLIADNAEGIAKIIQQIECDSKLPILEMEYNNMDKLPTESTNQ